MGKDDYASSGGVLKLKGVKDSKISKKKRKRKNAETDDLKPKELSEAFTEGTTAAGNIPGDSALDTASTEQEVDNHEVYAGKTETERRHEETKRKRVRIYEEGIPDKSYG